ncbi:MAG: phosphotransferase [Chloroflexi bacterium]|nr:phosphotransferase [Chloroflexota bacterium]
MQGFSRSALAGLILAHLPDAGELSFERIATGKFNTSFYVRAGNADLVLRIAPPQDAVFVFYERDMMRQEPGIHALVRARTEVPVARILAFDDSHSLIDRDYMIMARLPGRPLTEMNYVDNAAVLRQVGQQLAQVHALTADRYGYLGAHRPMQPQQTWAAAFEIMWHRMIDDIAAVGHYDAEESHLMRQLLTHSLQLFDRPVPASLLHMDIWHQNILVDGNGHVTGLVDWDRALWGDPEIEYAVLDYCGISEPAFWEGYGRPRDESREAEIRRVFYLLYELQKYIVIEQGRAGRAAGARRYKQQVMQIVRSFTIG